MYALSDFPVEFTKTNCRDPVVSNVQAAIASKSASNESLGSV